MSATPRTRPAAGGQGSDAIRGICVIMAGGRGTRFWPLSRTARPKQLLDLGSGQSLLRDTFERVLPLVGVDRVLVVTAGNLAAAVRAALPEIPADHVITEPVGRNTAPCAVLGMGLARRLDPSAPVALLPADHHIPDTDAFRAQLAAAFALVGAEPAVATFGIRPSQPHTGYGYLEVAAGAAGDVLAGLAFVEKPDAETAARYVAGGRHYWNSGIFVWNPSWFGTMADRFLADVRRLMAEPVATFGTGAFAAALTAAYGVCPAASIDQAIMEKLPGFKVIPATFGWSDLGDWEAWGELAGPVSDGSPDGRADGAGPANLGRADLLALASSGNIVRGERRLVALIGVDDLVVVDTPDALLICRRDQTQRLRDVIALLEKDGRRELL